MKNGEVERTSRKERAVRSRDAHCAPSRSDRSCVRPHGTIGSGGWGTRKLIVISFKLLSPKWPRRSCVGILICVLTFFYDLDPNSAHARFNEPVLDHSFPGPRLASYLGGAGSCERVVQY